MGAETSAAIQAGSESRSVGLGLGRQPPSAGQAPIWLHCVAA